MARILLTGNRGFFGTRFHDVHGRNHEIVGIDKDDLDIVDQMSVTRFVEDLRPKLIIHAAAITATDFSNDNPELTQQINVDGAVNVAEAAKRTGAQLIFFSTEQVFNGNIEPGPYSEDDVPVPDTMYGKTKLEAESRLKEIIEELWILRFTWLFGIPERQRPVNPNILWNALEIALKGNREKVAVHEYRGHTYGYDMIDAVMQVPRIPYGTYHIGSRNDLGRYELTRFILKELGLSEQKIDGLVEPDTEKYAQRHRDLRLSTEKIAAAGIAFDESPAAISRALEEFGLRGAAE